MCPEEAKRRKWQIGWEHRVGRLDSVFGKSKLETLAPKRKKKGKVVGVGKTTG